MHGPRLLPIYLLAVSGLALAARSAAGQDLFEEFSGEPPPISESSNDGVFPTAFFQPPALDQPVEPARSPARPSSLGSRRRLASVPNMFGDIGIMTATALFIDPQGNQRSVGAFDIPGAGGSRRVKIAENSSPFPVDRVYFMYNHFHNVYEFQETQVVPILQTFQRQLPIDRYTVGVEKTFWDEWASVELRLPMNGSLDAAGSAFAVNGGHYGNLAVIVKRLLYDDGVLAMSAGLGLDLPTGSEAEGRIGTNRFTFENDSVHLLPYLGLIWQPADELFFTGFLQVDVAANGNEVVLATPGFPQRSLGQYNEQNLLYADLGAGYWLYRNPYAEFITGVAALVEAHYTTAVQDSDAVLVETSQLTMQISNPLNRFDVVNATLGVNFDFSGTANLRVAGVFPLGDEADQRLFDSEVQVQFNHRY
jgi:hypothetical protein